MNNQIVEISLFYCSNSFSIEEIHTVSSKIEKVNVHAVSLPCSGKVNLLYLLKAVETGSQGVILLTCKIGECKFLQGNMRAQKRIEAVDDLLEETGFGKGCIKCVNIEENNKIEQLVNEISNLSLHVKTNLQLIK